MRMNYSISNVPNNIFCFCLIAKWPKWMLFKFGLFYRYPREPGNKSNAKQVSSVVSKWSVHVTYVDWISLVPVPHCFSLLRSLHSHGNQPLIDSNAVNFHLLANAFSLTFHENRSRVEHYGIFMEQNSRERGLRVRRREGMGNRCQIACRESKHVFLFVAMMHMPFAGAIIASAFESFTINLFLNLPSFLTQINLFSIQFCYLTSFSFGNIYIQPCCRCSLLNFGDCSEFKSISGQN